MKKNYFIILFLLLSIVGNSQNSYKIRTIVIDPGHGGKDPGAVTKNCYEKNIVLPISLKVGNYIEKNCKDVNVIYTRDTDTFIGLYERSQIANRNDADLFISIHANSNESSKPYGTSTYVMGVNRSQANLAVAKRENSVISHEKNYESKYLGINQNSPEGEIIMSLMQNTFYEQSIYFAMKVEGQFKTTGKRRSLGVKQAPFLVLWTTTMPSVLIEIGFISNPTEEKYLMSKKGQENIAKSIYKAFKEYKNEIEGKSYVVPEIFIDDSEFVEEPPNYVEVFENQLNDSEYKAWKPVVQEIKDEPQNFIEVHKDELIFRVQISSSVKKLPKNSTVFKGLKNVDEIFYDGVYKYNIGATDNLEKITKIHSEVQKTIPEAFIVAYKNGKRITISMAKQELTK